MDKNNFLDDILDEEYASGPPIEGNTIKPVEPKIVVKEEPIKETQESKLLKFNDDRIAKSYEIEAMLADIDKPWLHVPISSSLVTSLFWHDIENNYCPAKIWYDRILHRHHSSMTNSMRDGVYYETALLGSGNGICITELPRHKRTGQKLKDHERIDIQIMNMKANVYPKREIDIMKGINTQVELEAKWKLDSRVIITGTPDIFPTTFINDDDENELAFIDVKLTANLSSTFGKFAWGDVSKIDIHQMLHYHFLARNFIIQDDIEQVQKYLLEEIMDKRQYMHGYYHVADYRVLEEALGNKFIEVVWDATKENEFNEKIRKVIEQMKKHFIFETWTDTNPCTENCGNCTVPCDARNKIEKL